MISYETVMLNLSTCSGKTTLHNVVMGFSAIKNRRIKKTITGHYVNVGSVGYDAMLTALVKVSLSFFLIKRPSIILNTEFLSS